MRSRITHALYAKMGISELSIDSGQAYVDLAVDLGTNPQRRQAMREAILAKCVVLYEDDAEVRDFEHFLLTAAGR